MKAVMISIMPKWCELIAAGKKTIEVRKTRPAIEKVGDKFKCYIYCTAGKPLWLTMSKNVMSDEAYNRIIDDIPILLNQKVIGEFVCDSFTDKYFALLDGSCLDCNELHEYANGKNIYGWHISDLVIYDKPKELSEFKKINRDCWYADLGLAKRDCPECKNENCFFSRPPQSWCYVEEREQNG